MNKYKICNGKKCLTISAVSIFLGYFGVGRMRVILVVLEMKSRCNKKRKEVLRILWIEHGWLYVMNVWLFGYFFMIYNAIYILKACFSNFMLNHFPKTFLHNTNLTLVSKDLQLDKNDSHKYNVWSSPTENYYTYSLNNLWMWWCYRKDRTCSSLRKQHMSSKLVLHAMKVFKMDFALSSIGLFSRQTWDLNMALLFFLLS